MLDTKKTVHFWEERYAFKLYDVSQHERVRLILRAIKIII